MAENLSRTGIITCRNPYCVRGGRIQDLHLRSRDENEALFPPSLKRVRNCYPLPSSKFLI